MAGIVYFLAVLPRAAISPISLAGFKAVWAVTGFGVSSVLAVIYRAGNLVDRGLGRAAIGAVLLSGIVAILWVHGLGYLAYWISGTPDLLFTKASLPFVALNHLFSHLAWSGGYLAIAYGQRSRVEER
jgi:hypothetical protein